MDGTAKGVGGGRVAKWTGRAARGVGGRRVGWVARGVGGGRVGGVAIGVGGGRVLPAGDACVSEAGLVWEDG